jgi:hypothetical protein
MKLKINSLMVAVMHDEISSCVINQCRITVIYDTIYVLDEFW